MGGSRTCAALSSACSDDHQVNDEYAKKSLRLEVDPWNKRDADRDEPQGRPRPFPAELLIIESTAN